MFLLSFSYLQEQINQPGGFLTYLGELQTAFYFYPLPGAILVTLEICIIIFIIGKIGKKLTKNRNLLLPFIIGATLFYLQTNYQYSAFNNLGILIQLLLFYIVISFSNQKLTWFAVVLYPAFYFLFGSFSLLFLGLMTLFFIQQKSWIKLILLFAGGLLFFWIGSEFLFFQTTETLLLFPFSVQDLGLQTQLFLFTVGVIVLLPLLFQIRFKKVTGLSILKIRLVELVPFIVIIGLISAVIPRIDKKNSHYFHVEKLFYEQKYNEIIQFNSDFYSTNILTAFLNNLALAETGRLSDSFFSFPQTPDGGTLFLKWEMISEVLKRGGYFYYSLGMINEAQRWAYEYMVMKGNSPELLKLMIKTDLIKGKYDVAAKYISILEHSIFYRKDAAEFKKMLYNEKAIEEHPELGKKKRLDTKEDFFVLSDNPAFNLDMILLSDPSNIMGIEYKLADLMLRKDMQGIVDLLPVMEKAGYTRIPKNVEEAVVSFKLLKVGEMPVLNRLKINPETEQRFSRYYAIFQQNSTNKQQAQRALSKEFSNTYWYYVFFN